MRGNAERLQTYEQLKCTGAGTSVRFVVSGRLYEVWPQKTGRYLDPVDRAAPMGHTGSVLPLRAVFNVAGLQPLRVMRVFIVAPSRRAWFSEV